MRRAELRLRRLVSELQNKLADAEVDARYQRLRRRDRKEKRHRVYRLVKNLERVSVRMDGTKNHGCPHIHCDIGRKRHAASIAIKDGEVLAGKLTRRQLREVQDWIERHVKALMLLWKEMQAGNPVDALICELQAKAGQ